MTVSVQLYIMVPLGLYFKMKQEQFLFLNSLY